jgi:hypothetical protein
MRLRAFAGAIRGNALQPLCALSLLWACTASADQVEMSNGDRYVGRVLSLSGETLVLRSEVLGNLRLPRSRISSILLQPGTVVASGTNMSRFALVAPRPKAASSSNAPRRVSGLSSTNASADFSAAMQQLGANSNVLRQVQDQLLTGAGPEAQAKFNDLMGGLISGKIDLAGLRTQAKSTLEQAKQERGELGEEGGGMLDSYLAILDGFLKETEPEPSVTNGIPPAPPTPPAQALPQQR